MQNLETTLQNLENSFTRFKQAQSQRLDQLEDTFTTCPPQKKNLLVRPDGALKAEIPSTGFLTYVRQGVVPSQYKSMSTSTEGSGGYLIPEYISEKIMTTLERLSIFRSLAHVDHISTSALDILQDRQEPGVGWVGEDEERSETDTPELSKINIPVHEIYAKPRCTQKLLDDAKINVEEWLIQKVSDKIARMETQAFINGNGENKPTGFLTYDLVPSDQWEWGKIEHFKTGLNGQFSKPNPADILIETLQAMKPMYLNDAVWLMSRSALAAVRKLKNGFEDYILQPGLTLKGPSSMLGYPVVLCDEMPSLIPGQASHAIVFANFKEAYRIVDRTDLYVLRDPYSSKPYVEFYTTKRVGGDLVNFEAIKVISFMVDEVAEGTFASEEADE